MNGRYEVVDTYHHVALLERAARELQLAEEAGEYDAGEEEATACCKAAIARTLR